MQISQGPYVCTSGVSCATMVLRTLRSHQQWSPTLQTKTLVQNLVFKNKVTVMLESGEGNGTPLQYSCLENPMDRGAW